MENFTLSPNEEIARILMKNPGKNRFRFIQHEGETLLCLTDMARALGYKHPTSAVQRFCSGKIYVPLPPQEALKQRISGLWVGNSEEILKLFLSSPLRGV